MNNRSNGHKDDPQGSWDNITQSENKKNKESTSFFLVGIFFDFTVLISRIMGTVDSSYIKTHGLRLEKSSLVIERWFAFHYN